MFCHMVQLQPGIRHHPQPRTRARSRDRCLHARDTDQLKLGRCDGKPAPGVVAERPLARDLHHPAQGLESAPAVTDLVVGARSPTTDVAHAEERAQEPHHFLIGEVLVEGAEHAAIRTTGVPFKLRGHGPGLPLRGPLPATSFGAIHPRATRAPPRERAGLLPGARPGQAVRAARRCARPTWPGGALRSWPGAASWPTAP